MYPSGGTCLIKIGHHHHFIESNLFWPWYRCNIAHLPLSNNHSLTQWNICIRVNEACSVYTWYLQVKNESEKWPHRWLFELVTSDHTIYLSHTLYWLAFIEVWQLHKNRLWSAVLYVLGCMKFKTILHQFWVKKIFLWKFNLEYGGIFTKPFMHVSSRNMFPTTRNLQKRVHVYRPRHCYGDFRLFCSDDCRSWPREEKINNHGSRGKHAYIPDNDYWGICLFHVVWTNFFLQLFLCGTHGMYIYIYIYIYIYFINWTWAIISPKEFKSWVTRISFALLYWKNELSAVKYFAICS